MISLDDIFPKKEPTAEGLACDARGRRLGLDISQKELANISNVPLSTLKMFEKTGKISLHSFVAICAALGVGQSLNALITPAPPKTLDEVDGRKAIRLRKRASAKRQTES